MLTPFKQITVENCFPILMRNVFQNIKKNGILLKMLQYFEFLKDVLINMIIITSPTEAFVSLNASYFFYCLV